MSKPSFNLAACTAGHIRLPGGLIINYTLLIISGKNFHYVHSSPGRYVIICKKHSYTARRRRRGLFFPRARASVSLAAADACILRC